MNRFPKDLDLSPILGGIITQIRVGQFDIQFSVGSIDFAVQSPIELLRDGKIIGQWSEGNWPDSEFYNLMNSEVVDWKINSDKEISIRFINGIEMQLVDLDEYESMQIYFDEDTKLIV